VTDHAVEVEAFIGGSWVAAPTYVSDGITASRGAAGEGQESPPSAVSLTLEGTWSPADVTGPLATVAGRNLPVRVSADGAVQALVEAASWAPDRNLKGNVTWTKLQGAGILRRLQQGTTPLRTPLERAILASNPIAYWPLSDGKEATVLLSGVADGRDMVLFGARPGVVDGPTAAGGLAFLDVAGAPVSARAPAPVLPAAGWGTDFMVYLGPVNDPDQQTEQVALQWFIGGARWKASVTINPFSSTPPAILIFDDDGGVAFVGDSDTVLYGWNHIRVTYEQVGGNIEVELYVNGVNTSSFAGAGTLYSTTNEVIAGQIVDPLIPEWTFETVGVGYWAFYALADATDHAAAAFGYVGELAGERFLRVAGEEGVTAVVVGDETDTQEMGPQVPDTFVNTLRECVTTDDGLFCEPRDDRAVMMVTGRSRYNQDAATVFNFAAGQFAPGFVPVFDDAQTRNDVTAARRNGGTARAIQTSGPLNVNDPLDDPDGVGRVDTRVDVNTATDDALPGHAGWHLAKGTQTDPRFKAITVDLDAAPALTAVVDALEIGQRFDVGGLPVAWQPEPARLLLIGIKQSFPAGAGEFRRLVSLVAVPYGVFEIAVVGADDGSTDLRGTAVDTDNSTLASGVTSSATTLSVASTGGTLWTTNSDDWNPARNGGGLYITVGGERMRVTNITGAASPQTFTVVRSDNGVVLAHNAGDPVHVAYPLRVGL